MCCKNCVVVMGLIYGVTLAKELSIVYTLLNCIVAVLPHDAMCLPASLLLLQLLLGVGLLRQDCFLVATGVSFNAGQMHGDKLSPEHAD